MQKKSVILYFVKDPVPGKVKTRLARSIGERAAAGHYADLASQNFKEILPLTSEHIDSWVVYDPPESLERIREWLPGAAVYQAQQGEGLTERLRHAFKSAFAGGAGYVCALGSDTLNFKASWIGEGSRALQDHDVIIGPAEDGGYYLIGFKKMNKELFENIEWSTASVLKQTLKQAEK